MEHIPASDHADFEKAVDVLCSPGNREFMEDVAEKIRREPSYLTLHDFSVSMLVSTKLSKAGIHWPAEAVTKFEREALLSALKRLELL